MAINHDFTRRVAIHTGDLPWQASPMPGVERRMLDRIGDEVARATSLVRYAPGSKFSAHTHGGGEEFIVLDGVFEDESGAFPAGSYIRNPPTTSHTPGSTPGCMIFVKLWQFVPDDRTQIRLDLNKLEAIADPDRAGVRITPLFQDAQETVRREIWAPGVTYGLTADGGAEILVLNGRLDEAGQAFGKHDWLRLPQGYRATLTASDEGVEFWIKTGHLRHIQIPS